jgi:hypothetical protein
MTTFNYEIKDLTVDIFVLFFLELSDLNLFSVIEKNTDD